MAFPLRTPPPARPPPPVPQPKPPSPPPSPSPPPPRDDTPSPQPQEPPQEDATPTTATSPPLSPLRFAAPLRSLPPATAPRRPPLRLATDALALTPSQGSPAKTPSPSPTPSPAPQPLHLATGALAQTPSQGSPAKTPSPSPTPSPAPQPLHHATGALALTPSQGSPAKTPSPSPTPAPPPPPPSHANSSSDGRHGTPDHTEPAAAAPSAAAAMQVATQFDAAEEAITSPLRTDKPKRSPAVAGRMEQQQAVSAAGDGGVVPAAARSFVVREDARMASAALRVAAATLCLAAFSVMASDRTSGWAGDRYGRYEEYRYAVGVNVIACAYSIWQAYSEVRGIVTRGFILRNTSTYYFDLAMDQILAYLLMSASSAAASRNDLWVAQFGGDAFTRKIGSSVCLSFLAFLALAASSVISAANLFSI